MLNKTYRPEVWRRYRKYYRVDLMFSRVSSLQWAAFFLSLPWLLAFVILLCTYEV